LSCLVAFELKIGEFRPEYIGKMNLYLEALDGEVKKKRKIIIFNEVIFEQSKKLRFVRFKNIFQRELFCDIIVMSPFGMWFMVLCNSIISQT